MSDIAVVSPLPLDLPDEGLPVEAIRSKTFYYVDFHFYDSENIAKGLLCNGPAFLR